jgi:hypothetical protein
MARKLRVGYRGAICHDPNRGDRRDSMLQSGEDRWSFLERVGEAWVKNRWIGRGPCLMAEEFKRWRWSESELKRLANVEPRKLQLAHCLRAETTATVGWIAKRLRMGAPGCGTALYRQRQHGRF